MLEEVLKSELTKDQQDVGLSLSDEEHFLPLRIEGRIVSILGINSTIQDIRREADKHFNHKGLWCPYSNIFCQEGWCSSCNLFGVK